MKDLSILDYKIYAHRGIHEDVLENSIDAFKLAIDRSLPIELDVRLTKDKKVIVYHDKSLKRLFDKTDKIRDLKYKKILKLTNREVCTLESVLRLVNGEVPIIIEVKKTKKDYKLEKVLVKILDDYDGKFAVKSFDRKTMLWFKKNREEYIRGLLVHNNIKTIFDRYRLYRTIKKIDPDFLSVSYKLLNHRFMQRYRKRMKMLAYTVKSKEVYDKYKNLSDGLLCENIDEIGCDYYSRLL